MARSVWKGPFVEESLIKKVDKSKNDPNRKEPPAPKDVHWEKMKEEMARDKKYKNAEDIAAAKEVPTSEVVAD